MRSRYILVCVMIMVALGACALVAGAQSDRYDVFVTCPSSDYGINDAAEMTVWTMNKGLPEDPATVNLTVGETARFVTLARQDTGQFKAVFSLSAIDLDEQGRLSARARAKFFNSTTGAEYEKGGRGSFTTSLSGAFRVDLIVPELKDEHVGIGQTIHLQIRTSWKGTPVDADPGAVGFRDFLSPSSIKHIGVGLYESSWVVPAYTWFYESDGLLFEAFANYTVSGWTASDYDQRMVLLNHFRVWFHEVNVTTTAANVEVYVLDRNGTAVVGANVTLEFSETPWDAVERVRGTLYGVTDGSGRAEFTVDYSELNESRHSMYFLGEVRHGGMSQNFDEHIYVRDPPSVPEEPAGPPYELWDSEPLPAGKVVTLLGQFSGTGEPGPGTEVLLYIVGQCGILFNGMLVTNETGWIDVTIRTPDLGPGEKYTYLDFTRVIWLGDRWSGEWGLQRVVGVRPSGGLWERYRDASTTINVSRASSGGAVKVTIDHPDADGSQEKVGVAWGFGALPSQYPSAGALWRWTRLHCCNWSPYDPLCWVSVVECTWTGTDYEGIIDVPAFIQDTGPMWFYSTIQFLDSPVEDLRGAYLENVTPPVAGDEPPLVTIETPIEASTCCGLLVARGTAWDSFSVRSVEVRLDGFEWTRAVGTLAWTHRIDTTTLAWGEHVLEVRSFDGYYFSELARVTFLVDNPPSRPTADLVGDEWLMGVVPVNGTAPDDGGIVRIEVRIDRGEWVTAEGASFWSHLLDTTGLSRGEHTFGARSFDGTHWSEVLELPFLVDNPPTIEGFIVVPDPGAPTTLEVQGRASDDGGVELVEYRVGDGDWTPANGTANWRLSLDTISYGPGELTILVRAFDGHLHSEVESVILIIDNPPEVTSVGLVEGQRVEGVVEVRGTAWDDDRIHRVEVRVDTGDWTAADGTASWFFSMDTGPLARGPHTLWVRAYDGSHWSPALEVGFVVDRCPRVAILRPFAGTVCNGTVEFNGTAWDDGELRTVEVSIDDGPWQLLVGLSSWRFELDTTTLSAGTHRVVIRAFDGSLFSQPVDVTFNVDQPPSASIVTPGPSGRYSGTLTISGTATDDIAVTLVEWRVDGGSWHIATGTTAWSDSIDCTQLSEGAHTLEARCFDGVSRSGTESVEFEVYRDDTSAASAQGGFLTWGLLTAMVVLVVALAILLVRRSRR